jgi:hypothetical protein
MCLKASGETLAISAWLMSLAAELVERGLDIGCIPERDGGQRQAKSTELLLLLLAVDLSDLAAVAVADATGQPVPKLLPIELGEDSAPLRWHSGRTACAVRRTRNGSAWRAKLRVIAEVRSRTKNQWFTSRKNPMRNRPLMR